MEVALKHTMAVDEAAEVLGISPALARKDELPGLLRLGVKRQRVSGPALAKYLESGGQGFSPKPTKAHS